MAPLLHPDPGAGPLECLPAVLDEERQDLPKVFTIGLTRDYMNLRTSKPSAY